MQFVKVLYLHNKTVVKKWVGNKIVHQYVHKNNNVTSMLHYIGRWCVYKTILIK